MNIKNQDAEGAWKVSQEFRKKKKKDDDWGHKLLYIVLIEL